MKQKVAIEIISSLLILLFVYAAFNKLIEYSAFKTQLMNQLFFKTFAGMIIRTGMAAGWALGRPRVHLQKSIF